MDIRPRVQGESLERGPCFLLWASRYADTWSQSSEQPVQAWCRVSVHECLVSESGDQGWSKGPDPARQLLDWMECAGGGGGDGGGRVRGIRERALKEPAHLDDWSPGLQNRSPLNCGVPESTP